MTTFGERTGTDETILLHRRMSVLGLDVGGWLNIEPAMMADVEETCSACASRGQCAYDLATHLDEPTWPGWREYCPNTARLRMLVALQGIVEKKLTIERRSNVWAAITDSVDGS